MKIDKKIPHQAPPGGNTVKNGTKLQDNTQCCCLSFRFFKKDCINNREFNNHYRDENHFQKVISSFIGTVLPAISCLPASQLSGGRFAEQFHFHKVEGDKLDKVQVILKSYSFPDSQISQFLDGGNIFQFAGNLEGSEESRIICEYVNGIIYVLFFDTNHHIYLNKNKAGESLGFSCCPYQEKKLCINAYNCFAKDYLDMSKIKDSYGNDFSFT
jgi:hypothetical protein